MGLRFRRTILFLLLSIMFVHLSFNDNNKHGERTDSQDIKTTEEAYKEVTDPDKILEYTNKAEENSILVSLGEFKLTAYCSCSICCGKYAYNRPKDEYGNEIVYGSIGEELIAGKSIAVDPRVIPYWSEIVINKHSYIAHDTGSAIKGNRIDVYFDSHQEALNFGVQYAEIFIKKEL